MKIGRGKESKTADYVEDDRQALVVHAVYKSRMTAGVGQPPKLR